MSNGGMITDDYQTHRRVAQFDLSVEQNIIGLALRKPKFMEQVCHVLNPAHFSPEYQSIIKIALRYYKRHKKLLDPSALVEAAHVSRALVKSLFHLDMAELSIPFYVERYVQFARTFELERILIYGAQKIETAAAGTDDVDFADLERLMRSALQIGAVVDTGIDYFANVSGRLKGVKELHKNRIPTGFRLLDKLLHGGLDIGELGVSVSVPHAGKSMTAINFGYGGLMRGAHVYHSTLEMSPAQVSVRYDCRTCRMTEEEITQKRITATKIIQAVRDVQKGSLYIKDHRENRPSVASLGARIRRHSEEFGMPDIVIVDYADLLKPTSGGRDVKKYQQIADIYTDLRFLANELKTRIWTISQANRSGFQTDVIDLENLAESIDKAAVADIIIALCKTRDEHSKGVLRYHVAKNRGGPSGQIIKCRFDFTRSFIEEAGS